MAPKKKAAAKKEDKKAPAAKEEGAAKAAATAAPAVPPVPKRAAAKAKEEDATAAGKKRKAEAAAAGPSAKESKKESEQEPKESKKAAEGGEKEKDARPDKRSPLKEAIGFEPADVTLNVVPAMDGRILASLSDGAMQYLVAGARANRGMSAGRYMYEVKVVEALNPSEGAINSRMVTGRVPTPKQMLRIGFSVAGASLFLGESEDGVCFDAEGYFLAGGQKTQTSQRFGRDQIIAIVLNLDPQSPNANTLSLFKDGERIAEPQALPESLRGKALFPHVAFRNVTLQNNFGPEPLKALPFQCTTLQAAAQADIVEAPAVVQTQYHKHEVLFPVAFPDEGTFGWLDQFLERNPHFVELSDRKLHEWAAKSGLVKPKPPVPTGRESNDKPEFGYGLPSLDDLSLRTMVRKMAAIVPRSYVVMEVKENLVASDRQANLARFFAPHFKKIAQVVMGEPTKEWKAEVHKTLLAEKQEKAYSEWKARRAEKDKARAAKAREKELAKLRKRQEAERKKKAEEARRKIEEARKRLEEKKRKEAEAVIAARKKKEEEEEAAKKAAEAAARKAAKAAEKGSEEGEEAEEEEAAGDGEEGGEEKAETTEEHTEEGVKTEEADGDVEKKEDVKEEGDTDMGKEVKEEEKPEAKEEKPEAKEEEEEGDEEEDAEMEDDSDKEPPVAELTEEEEKIFFLPQSTPDLSPEVLNQSFGGFSIPEKEEGFDDIRFEWQDEKASTAYLRKWVLERKVTSRVEDLQPSEWFKAKIAAFKKAVEEWKAKQKPFLLKKKEPKKKVKKEGSGGNGEEDAAMGVEEEKNEEEEEEKSDDDDLDVLAVEDIYDIGEGAPLFGNFESEDWALLTTRYELWLMIDAYKREVNDPDRLGVHESNIDFYYQKYFNKNLVPKHYDKENIAQVILLMKDTVLIDASTQVLVSNLAEDVDMEYFVKLVEEHRRERQRRVDAGDETARLKISPLVHQVVQPRPAPVPVTTPVVLTTAQPVRPYAGRPGIPVRPAQWPQGRPVAPQWRPAQQQYMPRPYAQQQQWR